MIPVFGDPIDSAEDIFKQGKTPIIGQGFWPNYLRTSNDLWIKKTGKISFILSILVNMKILQYSSNLNFYTLIRKLQKKLKFF